MVKFKTKILKEYLLTIFVSLVILLAISMILQIELMFRCEKNVNFNELNVENLSKFYTIEELEKKLIEHPENIIINIRLGIMYESLENLIKQMIIIRLHLSFQEGQILRYIHMLCFVLGEIYFCLLQLWLKN